MFVGRRSGYKFYSHDGGVNGFLAVLQYYPQIEGSVVILSNLLDPLAMKGVVERMSGVFLGEAA